MKIAILGANGQIGAEICLILRNRSDISLVPVCRNRLGSAFLRFQGIACRHGLIADAGQAAKLFGDCPTIAHFALGSGSLREAADINQRLIRNAIEFSPPNATILYFSTVTVYGNPDPRARIRWKNAYAREKLRCERLAIELGRKFNKKVFVLRLGHVCGDLQGISSVIRQELARGAVVLPAPDRKSNVVHVATIVDAILKASSGELGNPGIYDLLNMPQWTWREIYRYEAQKIGKRFEIEQSGIEMSQKNSSLARRLIANVGQILLGNPTRKEYAMQLIARLSIPLNKRIQAVYYKNRAASEIAALNKHVIQNDALKWREVGWNHLKNLNKTEDLLSSPEYRISDKPPSVRWPDEMQLAPSNT